MHNEISRYCPKGVFEFGIDCQGWLKVGDDDDSGQS